MMRWLCFRARRVVSADNRDGGFGLVFVMLISTVALILLGTASSALITQITPTTHSQDDGAAIAAAEAGLEDFIAQVNENCTDMDGFDCVWLQTPSLNSQGSSIDPTTTIGTPVTGTDGTGNRAWFYWQVKYAVAGAARVVSYGQVPQSGSTCPCRTKALAADIRATPNYTNFEYYTKYETFPSDFVDSFYAQRNVTINSGDATGSTLSGPGTLHWNGACDSSDPTNLSTCVPTGASASQQSTNICDDLYFPYSGGLGRGTDTAWNNTGGRRPPASVQTRMGTNSSFSYYNEQGLFTPTSGSPVDETHWDVCDSSFEPNMVMNGPIYSEDAYLIDRGKDTGGSKNSMPIFNDPAYSMWDGVINGVQQAPGPNGGYMRAYPSPDGTANGQIYTSITPQPVYTSQELALPATPAAALPYASCLYTGPTRILLKQSVAYITSPMTDPTTAVGPAYCYTSTGNFSNTGSSANGGVVNAQVPITSTLIYVQDAGSPGTATRTNPVFNLSTNLSVPASTSGDTLSGTWTDDATYDSTTACPSPAPVPADTTKRRTFDCETSAANPAADQFKAIKQAVDGVVSDTTIADADVHDKLVNKIQSVIDKGGVLVTSAPASLNKGDVRYQVTVGALSTGTATTTKPDSQSDDFFQSTAGQGFTTTPKSWQITLTRYACTTQATCTSSKQDISTPVTGKATRTTNSANSPVNSTSSFPWFGPQSSPYTDPSDDITQYSTGYGDVYIQGTLHGQLTVAATHDILVTNDLLYSDTNVNTTTDGLALVAQHNVRVYRPMRCTDDDPSRQTGLLDASGQVMPGVGVCPDDLTGVYGDTPQWPPTQNPNYPSTKYVATTAPSMTSTGTGTIYGTIFTLRGCFMVDNFYRGTIGSGVTITGGLYQYHRGPTSLPYQGRPYQGSTTKMPGVVLTYTYDNMRAGQQQSAGLRVPWIPNPSGRPTGSPRPWNIVSVSTAS